MRRLILTAAVVLAGGLTASAGPFQRLAANIQERRAARHQCQQAPTASYQSGPVRQIAANVLTATGGVFAASGETVRSTTFRPAWNAGPTCANGSCNIPATNLPVGR